MNLLFKCITSAAESICIIAFLTTFFPPKHNRILKISMLCVAYALYFYFPSHTLFSHSFLLKLLISILIWFGYACIANHGKLLAKFFAVSMFFVTLSALDFLTMSTITLIFQISAIHALNNTGFYLLGSFCSRTLLLILTFAIRKLHKQQKDYSISISTWISLLVLPIFTIILFSLLFQQTILRGESPLSFIALGGGLLALNIAFIALLDKLEQADQIRLENRQLQRAAEQNLQSANAMQLVYQEQRVHTHDFNNHISTLYTLLSSKQYDTATEYASSLTLMPDVGCIVNTNNPIIDAVLNQKYALAKAQHTSMRFTVNDLSNFSMQDIDIVTLLGNLLDNALEACKKIDHTTTIHVKMFMENNAVLLHVSNSSLPVCITADKTIISDKQNPTLHGFGLRNIRRILSKYGCEFSISYKNGFFDFTTIIL